MLKLLKVTKVQNDEGGPGGRDTFPHNRFLTAFPLSKVGEIFGPFPSKSERLTYFHSAVFTEMKIVVKYPSPPIS